MPRSAPIPPAEFATLVALARDPLDAMLLAGIPTWRLLDQYIAGERPVPRSVVIALASSLVIRLGTRAELLPHLAMPIREAVGPRSRET